MMFMYDHVYDVARCSNTVRNVALGLWLVGLPWPKPSKELRSQDRILYWNQMKLHMNWKQVFLQISCW